MDGPCGVHSRLEDGCRHRPRGDSCATRVVVFRRGPSRGSARCRKPGRLGNRGHEGPQRRARLAYSRIVLARLLSETGRPDAAEPAARAAAAWFERWGRSHPKFANAECEVGRAQVLQGRTAEGRAVLERCLPIYRAWGHADPRAVQSLDRLLADAAPADRSGQGPEQWPDASAVQRAVGPVHVTRRFDAIPVVTSTYMTDTGVGRSSDWAHADRGTRSGAAAPRRPAGPLHQPRQRRHYATTARRARRGPAIPALLLERSPGLGRQVTSQHGRLRRGAPHHRAFRGRQHRHQHGDLRQEHD